MRGVGCRHQTVLTRYGTLRTARRLDRPQPLRHPAVRGRRRLSQRARGRRGRPARAPYGRAGTEECWLYVRVGRRARLSGPRVHDVDGLLRSPRQHRKSRYFRNRCCGLGIHRSTQRVDWAGPAAPQLRRPHRRQHPCRAVPAVVPHGHPGGRLHSVADVVGEGQARVCPRLPVHRRRHPPHCLQVLAPRVGRGHLAAVGIGVACRPGIAGGRPLTGRPHHPRPVAAPAPHHAQSARGVPTSIRRRYRCFRRSSSHQRRWCWTT